jgi:hypothetical protein
MPSHTLLSPLWPPRRRRAARLLLATLSLLAVACGGDGATAPAPDDEEEGAAYVAAGRVTNARGEPLAGVEVVLDNQLLHNSNVVTRTGADGRYRVALPPIAVTWAASARMQRDFDGARYTIELAPVDPTPFAGNTGGVRDFVWRVRGAGPDGTWYGSSVVVYASLAQFDLDRRAVELTLTPVGSLIDGSAGQVIVGRPTSTGDGFAVVDVPVGRYAIAAREVGAGGSGRPLRIRLRNSGSYASSVTTGFAAPYGASLAIYRIDLEVER